MPHRTDKRCNVDMWLFDMSRCPNPAKWRAKRTIPLEDRRTGNRHPVRLYLCAGCLRSHWDGRANFSGDDLFVRIPDAPQN